MTLPYPPEEPMEPVTPLPTQLPGLGRALRKRYAINTVVNEQMNANDLLNEVIFPASRMYLVQDEHGRIGFRNKKPEPYAFGQSQFTTAADTIAVDSVKEWASALDTWLLVSPHTDKSELHKVIEAKYSASQNSISISATPSIFTVTGFSGCDGDQVPATAKIEVNSAPTYTPLSVTVDGYEFRFTTRNADTKASIASYVAGVIASHPALFRRFRVTWAPGDEEVNITGAFGTLKLDTPLKFTTSTPVADPTTAPTLTASGSGTGLKAGTYAVAYAYDNEAGETLMSPFKQITITAGQKIDVSAITPLPSGVTSVRWYVSPQVNQAKMRYTSSNAGGAFSITTLPLLTAELPPDLNRTGCEVMRVEAVFSDRDEPRTSQSRSNVIKASFSWLLGNRSKAVNRIDLKYRDSAQDWRLVELRIRDDAHIEKIKKVVNEEVNGQAINNTDQAYRIAAGLLAEKRDADFFYKWKATREALLLQEGDVVAITDRGAGVINFPVMIEEIEFDVSRAALPVATFTARKYASTLYDDSVVERTIPVIIEH